MRTRTLEELKDAELRRAGNYLRGPHPPPKVVVIGGDGRLPRDRSISMMFSEGMLGLAIGDAMGAAVEFQRPGTFPPVTELRGGGPHRLKPGQWTDDTSMALCLAESLIAKGEFDARDQMIRYLRWYREGHYSSTGKCFDIGNTTRSALEAFERTGNPFSGPTDPDTAGNGSLMRLLPVVLFFWSDAKAIQMAGESSRTTHGAKVAVDACRYFAALLVGAWKGVPKEELLSPRYSPVRGHWEAHPLCPEVDAIARGSFKGKSASDLPAGGYVLETLEAALWAFATTDNFKDGCLKAVNLGNDADTTGAVYGQLAGAFYQGAVGLPEEWIAQLAPPLKATVLTMGDAFQEKWLQQSVSLADELQGSPCELGSVRYSGVEHVPVQGGPPEEIKLSRIAPEHFTSLEGGFAMVEEIHQVVSIVATRAILLGDNRRCRLDIERQHQFHRTRVGYYSPGPAWFWVGFIFDHERREVLLGVEMTLKGDWRHLKGKVPEGLREAFDIFPKYLGPGEPSKYVNTANSPLNQNINTSFAFVRPLDDSLNGSLEEVVEWLTSAVDGARELAVLTKTKDK